MRSSAARLVVDLDSGRQPMRPTKVGMLVGSASETSGGVYEALRALAAELHSPPELSVEIFTLGETSTTFFLGAPNGPIPVRVCRSRRPRSFGYSEELVPAMLRAELDLVHVHGLWMYPSVAALRWAKATSRPYVVSPHGMLDPWALANRAWKKRIARLLFEDRHLRRACCIHALCRPEADSIRAAGLHAPLFRVPNGVHLPTPQDGSPAWRCEVSADRILLFLGRLTPKKRVVELVQAFAAAKPIQGSWGLVIAGWGAADYVATVRREIGRMDLEGSVHLIGPVYGADKQATFAAADAFVLPSLSEGLPMAVLEAWSFGLPSLLTPECNLAEGFAEGAALPVGADVESLALGMSRLFGMPRQELATMGRNARRLAAEQFSWASAAVETEAVYRWALGQRPAPASVSH